MFQQLWTHGQDRWEGYSLQCDACKHWLEQCKSRACYIARSQLWTEAVNRSYDQILKSGVLHKDVTLLNDTQAALEALVNLPTMLLSEGSVSLGVLVLEPTAAVASGA